MGFIDKTKFITNEPKDSEITESLLSLQGQLESIDTGVFNKLNFFQEIIESFQTTIEGFSKKFNDLIPIGEIIAISPEVKIKPTKQHWVYCDGSKKYGKNFTYPDRLIPNITDERFLMGKISTICKLGGSNILKDHKHTTTKGELMLFNGLTVGLELSSHSEGKIPESGEHGHYTMSVGDEDDKTQISSEDAIKMWSSNELYKYELLAASEKPIYGKTSKEKHKHDFVQPVDHIIKTHPRLKDRMVLGEIGTHSAANANSIIDNPPKYVTVEFYLRYQ